MQPPRWTPGPLRPLLSEGVVHVWRANRSTAVEEPRELLSAAELARAERFSRDRDRLLWMQSRGLLRTLLARYLQTNAREIEIVAGDHGKPALGRSADSASLSFNLSHSGTIALYAFAPAHAVGVDVELARAKADTVALAERAFGAAAAERLAALEPAAREREFLRLWVRHEAELKCFGLGIGGSASARREEHRPWISELDVGETAAAAIAVEQQPHELRCWDWRASIS